MKKFVVLFTVLVGLVSFAAAGIAAYGKCGGKDYEGDNTCAGDAVCTPISGRYSQCLPHPKIRNTGSVSGYAAYGGTTGGAGGTTVRVSTLADLRSAVNGDSHKTVILTSSLSGKGSVNVDPNTTLMCAHGVKLQGIGIAVVDSYNVIIQNCNIAKVLAAEGDAIAIRNSNNVWVDHVDLSSDQSHGKDFYDGLLDITHGCENITVSYSHLHDHYKASLVGHSDNNGAQDKVITVTFHDNYFDNVYSRTPSVRFGRGHIFNNHYNVVDGIDARDDAQLLVENNVFVKTAKPLYASSDSPRPGFVVDNNNDFGGGKNTAPKGNFYKPPYDYALSSLDSVKSQVPSQAGAILSIT